MRNDPDDRGAVDRDRFTSAMAALAGQPVDARTKGYPPQAATVPLADVAGLGLNILAQDTPMPVCVARQSAIATNRQWMAAFLAANELAIAPHAKSTMAPHLLALQVEDGAWGFCVATVSQLAVLLSFGFRRLLIANQLVGDTNIDSVWAAIAADPTLELYALVDSLDGLELLMARSRHFTVQTPLHLLIEVGAPGGRTGCRTVEEAVALGEAIARAGPAVALCGVEAYESVFPTLTDDERQAAIDAILTRLLAVADLCRIRGLFAPGKIILSAGGSEYFDQCARRMKAWGHADMVTVLLRSGCYIAHDDLAYARGFDRLRARSPDMMPDLAPLEPVLEVWGVVQSRPEPKLALLTVGKRDISYDFELPTAKHWYRPHGDGQVCPIPADHKIVRLNDQHAYLQMPADSPLRVGDLVGLGISHPCTTFDKWALIYLVDDDYRVTGAIRTFF